MMQQPLERRAYRVTGRVQGVGFRWWTRRTAERLGLRGTVRNARDGSVEIHAEGSGEALEEFRQRLEAGPPGARVEGVSSQEWDIDAAPRDFRIVR